MGTFKKTQECATRESHMTCFIYGGETMRNIGYIRVSSEGQNSARQKDQLSHLGLDKIYEEVISGASMDRKELQELLKELQPGDTVYVTDLTRITRSTKDLFSLIEQFREKEALLVSLKDTWLNLSEDNPYSEFLLTVMAGVNQLERDLIRMRQKEGIAVAKKEGKYKGRMTRYTNSHEGLQHALELYDSGDMTVKRICSITKISKSTLYRAIEKRRNE